MKVSWRDVLAGLLVVVGVVVTYAKLQSFSWWLIGSWKGAVGLIAVIGLGILLTNIVELVKIVDMSVFAETLLWLMAATAAIASLLSATGKAEFVTTAVLIGLAWAAQFVRHIWVSTHRYSAHYVPMH